MRLLGVLRLSRVTEASVSIDKQREIINAYALAHGHDIVAWAEDPGVSGDISPFDRGSLGPWLQPDRAGEFDGLVAWKVDRISRRLAHFAQLLDWASEHHKVVVAVSDGIDTSTKIGKMVAQILSMFAEFELDSIKDRVKGTKAHLRATERFPGGAVPYGYMVEAIDPANPKAGKRLVHDPDSSAVVREMVTTILDGGSMADIRRTLQERGVPAPIDHDRIRRGQQSQGVEWSTRAVQAILTSRSLLGQKVHQGKVVRGQDGLPLQRAEPLISQDQWDRLQVALTEAARPRAYANGKALLSDVLTCGGCGGKVHRQVQRTGGKVTGTYYRCTSKNAGRPCSLPAAFRADVIEPAVTEAVLRAIGPVERRARHWVPGTDNSEVLAQVDKAIAELREEQDLGLYEGDRAGYLERLRGLTDRRKVLAALPIRAGGWKYVPTGQTYANSWAGMADSDRRSLLLAAGVRVHCGPLKDDPTPHLLVQIPDDIAERADGGNGKPVQRMRFDLAAVRVSVDWYTQWVGDIRR